MIAMETLVYEPVVPARWLAAAWIALPLLVAGYAAWRPPATGRARRIALAIGHAAPLAVVLWLLHGPTWIDLRTPEGTRPPLRILIDRSASMAAEATPGLSGSRFAAAARLVREHLPGWERFFSVSLGAFDRAGRPLAAEALAAPLAPDGPMTDLATAINEPLAGGNPPMALLVLSDGIHNASDADPLESARRARALGCPVYTLTLGSDAAVQDLGLALAEREGLTFVRQPYRALATLTHRGFENTAAAVTVRLDGRAVEERKVPITGPGDISLDFLLVQENPGLYEYEIAVEEHAGEVFRTNNRQRFTLRVVSDRIRTLVLEGKPYWDSKFLVQALKRDANVWLTSIMRVTDARTLVDGPFGGAAPDLAPKDPRCPLEDRSFLEMLQIVVLGKDTEIFLTPAAVANLREWIGRRGGHLVCARGRPVGARASQEDLLALLPLQWGLDEERRFRMDLTERGRMTTLFASTRKGPAGKPAGAVPEEDPRVILRQLSSLVTATRVEKERALAVVLARAQAGGPLAEMAALTYHPYGAGRVVIVEGQGLWRWAFRPPGHAAIQGAVFDTFWSNLVRWLVGSNDFLPSQFLALRAGKPSYLIDEHPVLYVIEKASADETASAPRTDPIVEVAREDGAAPGADAAAPPIRVQAAPVPGDPTMRRAVLDLLPEGRYRARLAVPPPPKTTGGAETAATIEAAFEVTPPLLERLDLRARPELMRSIAQASDGEALDPADAGRLADRFLNYIIRLRPDLESRTPAWDRPWLWGVIMAWLAALWFLRRKWGIL